MKREQLLRRLSAVQFALWETHVFLDTHAGDPKATEMQKKYSSKYNALVEEYEKQFGPLQLNGSNSDQWLQNPWPWDYIGEGDK